MKRDPQNIKAYLRAGQAHAGLQKPEEAAKWFRQALLLDKTSSAAQVRGMAAHHCHSHTIQHNCVWESTVLLVGHVMTLVSLLTCHNIVVAMSLLYLPQLYSQSSHATAKSDPNLHDHVRAAICFQGSVNSRQVLCIAGRKASWFRGSSQASICLFVHPYHALATYHHALSLSQGFGHAAVRLDLPCHKAWATLTCACS